MNQIEVVFRLLCDDKHFSIGDGISFFYKDKCVAGKITDISKGNSNDKDYIVLNAVEYFGFGDSEPYLSVKGPRVFYLRDIKRAQRVLN